MIKMQSFVTLSYLPTIIIRHRLENLKKCSLRGLETRPDFIFLTYPYDTQPDLDGYIILTLEAPPLTLEDAIHGLLVLDATWRYAAKMLKPFKDRPHFIYRSLPAHFRTVYPRYQNGCPDPERGLASIEAIYLSYRILQRDVTGLLDHYYWKEPFLNLNGLS
jgi:pre-rRNA-processing protein TSR3